MATVQLADIYNPLTFARRTQEAQLELNVFLSSGVMVTDAALQAQIGAGGNIGEMPNFNPLGTPEPNYSNDDPADTSTPNNIDSTKQTFRLCSQNQSWSTMDLTRELALEDPVGAITSKVGAYWATINERRVIQTMLGILADNVANDAGDMRITVATDDAAAVTDAERISPEVLINTKQTMGDHAAVLTTIAMHSVIYSRLQKQQDIEYLPTKLEGITIPTYLGYRVVVDDSLPAVAGAERVTYTCIMFGLGAIGSASGAVATPSELARAADAGNGGGQDVMHSRRSDLIHPLGFSFDSAAVAGQSATHAELATSTNWDRIWDRKHIPMAFLQVND